MSAKTGKLTGIRYIADVIARLGGREALSQAEESLRDNQASQFERDAAANRLKELRLRLFDPPGKNKTASGPPASNPAPHSPVSRDQVRCHVAEGHRGPVSGCKVCPPRRKRAETP
jgi:hypothetical protein